MGAYYHTAINLLVVGLEPEQKPEAEDGEEVENRSFCSFVNLAEKFFEHIVDVVHWPVVQDYDIKIFTECR